MTKTHELDVTKFTSEDAERGSHDTRRWFVVDPDKAYPATIDHIRRLLDMEDVPALSPELTTYLNAARALPAYAWDYAVVPRGDFPDAQIDALEAPDGQVIDVPAVNLREQALEIARLWFTQELHEIQDRAPMGVQIVKSDNWKL